MPKVRTLSRTFLKGHPRAGEPTYFMEKVYNSLYPEQIRQLPKDFSNWHFANQQNRGIANEFNLTFEAASSIKSMAYYRDWETDRKSVV